MNFSIFKKCDCHKTQINSKESEKRIDIYEN